MTAFQVSNADAGLATQIVGSVLDDVRPENVDRASVTVTEEGESAGIVLIPHRDLGGLALVLWITPEHAQLCWAAVFDLGRHDDLDLGKVIFRIERIKPGWEFALRSQIIAEMRRRIEVSVRRNWRGRPALWCTLEVRGKAVDVWVGAVPEFKGFGKGKVAAAGATSLQGPERPTQTRQVPLAGWHRGGAAAWASMSQRDV